ncbi:tetratricopeptide repeat protein [Gemmatimonas groenlandica]|uniref:Tetratricopeptide repeat protein n=1 Tax=Gemmatimonas groenlandica TaxID=2732249 RepID=A0A6M4IQ31_9BACT|nr:tetratricopeptide repeat protein [Gemmatimonas groenlandica]QJR36098.1 tetratricopeptide repeat protein [Gemmatimonas groenlandica]
MRKPLSPLQAFAADAGGATDRGVDLGAQLMSWLSVAQSADMLAGGSAPTEQALAQSTALLAEFGDQRPSMVHDALPEPTVPIPRIAERFRVAAEAMEIAGCYELAFTTVAAVCRLTAHADAVTATLATLHLGRIARQMNDFAAAQDCYDRVVVRATRERDAPLAARGHIGRALLSDMRGNIPAAEASYRKALDLAVPGGGAYTMACQGLITLAINRQQLGDALLYGWQLHDASAEDSELRYIALFELSVVALHAGFPEPALRGFTYTLERIAVPRLRLLVLGGVIRAAARLRRPHEVAATREAIERTIRDANQPHDAAQVLIQCAGALYEINDPSGARAALQAGRDLAARHGYHEFVFRADEMEASWSRSAPPEIPAADVAPRVRQRALRVGIERLTALR